MRRSIDPETALDYALQIPWWKRLWRRFTRRRSKPQVIQVGKPAARPAPQIPIQKPLETKIGTPGGRVEKVEDVLNEDARLRRTFGYAPVPVAAPSQEPAPETVGIWVLDQALDDPELGPVKIAYNTKLSSFGIVLQTPQGWHFWNGPEKNLFTRPGESQVWTTNHRRVALITASFLFTNSAAYARKLKKRPDEGNNVPELQ